jgi:hypothetical protein
MELMVATKAFCSLASVISGFVSCAYWYRSSIAEVPFSDITPGTDEIGIEVDGKEVAVFASSRLQSRLGSKGALAAAVAALFQLIPMLYDLWIVISAPAG